MHAAAVTLAAAAPAAASTAIGGRLMLFTPNFVVSLAHAILVGLPLYALLRFRGVAITWWTGAVGGFIVGALPLSLLAVVIVPDEASVGGIPTVLDGIRTAAGWLQVLVLGGWLGALGALGGLSFWLVVRRDVTSRASLPEVGVSGERALSWLLVGGSVTAAVSIMVAAAVIPALTRDRSCHNPLQVGRNSISSEFNLELGVGMSEWRSLDLELQGFAQERGWSHRGDVRPDIGFPWFQVSICAEVGTMIFASATDASGPVDIAIYQPQRGNDWREPYAAFYRRLETRWPDQVRLTGEGGQPVAAPAWLIRDPAPN